MVFAFTSLEALELKFIISFFTVIHLPVIIKSYLGRLAEIVGTVVGDVQLTVTIHQSKVAVTVQTSGMLCSNGYQVTVIDIAQYGCGIAQYGVGVGIDHITTGRNVTSGKHGITYNNAVKTYLAPSSYI